MNTAMHQRAFPGEDISDRPEPETVVPALLRLARQELPSGRYRAADLARGGVRVTAAVDLPAAAGAATPTSRPSTAD